MTQDRSNCDIARFQDLKERFAEAEGFIKEVELCGGELAFPAINELRYAGHHLLKALAEPNEDKFHKELGEVEDHCHRAMYEASEAGITYLIRLLKQFDWDYKDVVVSETVPNILEIRRLGTKASKQLSRGRLNRKSPTVQVKEYMEMFEELKNGVEILEAGRSELNIVKRKGVIDSRKYIGQVLFWISIVAIGIAGLVQCPDRSLAEPAGSEETAAVRRLVPNG
jgi:hypothetical protein